MKKLFTISLLFLLVGFANPSYLKKTTQNTAKGEKTMSAKGKFEVNPESQKDNEAPAGRLIIKKQYSGDLIGSGVGQMISKRTGSGAAVYYANKEFTGTVNGNSGSFTLVHKGFMSKQSQFLEVVILEGSGEGEFENITDSMVILQDDDNHSYEFNYNL